MIHNSICGSTMIKSNKRNPTALKHGGYSGVTLLPGENPAAFDKLHDELIAEFAPIGRFEEDIVASIAHLVWRKQNLSTYRLAEEAKNRISAIEREWIPPSDIADRYEDPEGYRQARQGADEEARAELGATMELVEVGDVATTDYLVDELSVVDRLDSMIDRCLKRLLFVRGLKSISPPASTARPPARKIAAA
jgi:hypothetical protein